MLVKFLAIQVMINPPKKIKEQTNWTYILKLNTSRQKSKMLSQFKMYGEYLVPKFKLDMYFNAM